MSKARRVAFSGAEVIEYDATLAPVVKFCGALGSLSTETRTLECHARGVEVSDGQLTRQYVEELQGFLRSRGFNPISVNLIELQIQRQVVELLQIWATLEHTKNPLLAVDVLNPKTLRRAQLATKQLEGHVDDSYAFGRRFVSISTYVDMLSSEELMEVAGAKAIELPTLDEKQRAGIKVRDLELVGRYETAKGRPLRSLTFRQIVMEVKKRGILGPKERNMKGKKSKRAWFDLLRRVTMSEVKDTKVREQQETMLREKVVYELEQEKREEQKQRVVELIHEIIKQSNDEGDWLEPEANDTTLDEAKHMEQVKARRFLETLVKTM